MSTRRYLPKVVYDGKLMLEDAAALGLDPQTLADRTEPKIHYRTVYRFLAGDVQTVPTANALAKALGQDVARYVVRSRTEAMAS